MTDAVGRSNFTPTTQRLHLIFSSGHRCQTTTLTAITRDDAP